MLHKAMSSVSEAEMHHEYMVHVIQPLAVRRYMGLVGADATQTVLRQTHGAAVHYCEKAQWGDSSNKLSWLIPDLVALFPHAKFVHLVRDGRKVAGSYFHKLGDECYDDRSTQILRAHVEDNAPAPPPEKKYWWPLPRRDDPGVKTFRAYSQFERIAWHWAEINRVILQDLVSIPKERQLFVKLEDLRAKPEILQNLFAFLGLSYRDEFFAMFQRPHNVNRPEDKLLSRDERTRFEAIAGPMMERLGYASEPEYVVNY
jgi:Sulfotransferase family